VNLLNRFKIEARLILLVTLSAVSLIAATSFSQMAADDNAPWFRVLHSHQRRHVNA
jgi:hypothetical protein